MPPFVSFPCGKDSSTTERHLEVLMTSSTQHDSRSADARPLGTPQWWWPVSR
ncbi:MULTISPECIES: hypothetical protein [unclassified Streptomyces]|uniref:hypothetical protein n=1 Tax=unclassified Streptomyces TaxID=2593676 RepID=UPI002E293DE3|nr:hypothetical protein [Streptomyces sp. NBC_00223]